MTLVLFNNLTEKEKSDAVKKLIKESSPRQDFFLMVALSFFMATFGLLMNNIAIIIGSMLITPILHPILGISLGIVIADMKLIRRSFYTVLKSMVFGIFGAMIITIFFSSQFELNYEIISRTELSFGYAAVALIAGFAASFAHIKPHLNDTLPGIAVSVAIIPPLAVIGIGIAKVNWSIISGAFLMFLINILGIIFASMVTFSLMNLYIKRKVVATTIKQETKAIEKEIKNAEKLQESE